MADDDETTKLTSASEDINETTSTNENENENENKAKTPKMASTTESTASTSSSNPPPTDAMMQLLAPDGYYTYLGIPKTPDLDEDLIKKNYRRLSLKHHPDKRGGDADTFRLLNRAQKVLTTSKLRQQYDNLGLDLDDDDDQAMTTNSQPNNDSGNGDDDDEQTTSQGIVHEIASMALTTVLQMGVRTCTYASYSIRFITLVIRLHILTF